ncbi:HNH endonuclease [Zoogloea sp.]|uniref:HNH endonuclease n=1 Tax=Zoogloea sp. TaxID=49181 RepID=UPI0035B2516C
MPVSAPKPCTSPGCKARAVPGGSRCEAHVVAAGSFADRSRGTRHQRGYGTDWDAKRLQILERDNGLCQECLRQGRVTPCGHKPFTAFCDHIRPKAEGGTDDDDNLQTLCSSCHRAKTDREKLRGRGRGRGV